MNYKMVKLSSPIKLIGLIIAGLFVSELITTSFEGTLDSLPRPLSSILDATIMMLTATPLLYFFSLRPLLKVISERETEISQRKQAESQLRIQTTALETAANGIFVSDKQGLIIWANQAFARMTGYSIKDIVGKTPKFLNSGVQDSDYYKRLWGTILSGNVWHGDTTNRRKDGTLYITEQTITPVINMSGEIENFIAIQQDITERKQAEKAIKERDLKANLLSQTIHSMQMDIARDLHDTVGQNISYLRMKLDHLADNEFLTDPVIALEIKGMGIVANESYDLIRGTLAVLQLEDSADLSLLLARYAAQIGERSTFKIEFSSKGEPKALSAKRMRQLFYIYREILNNIEKHANASNATIEVLWSDDHLALVVFDDGCGFEPINNIQHTGHYGLKFMRERVKLLDGTFVVKSAPGAGTNIVIHVPFET